MRVAWITRSFLDYRVPVFGELDRLLDGGLHLAFSRRYVPERVAEKARGVLGARALPLDGEWRLGREDRDFMANRNLSLRYQPGLSGVIGRIEPDVVVGDGFFKWTFGCLAACLRRRIPLVVTYERTRHTERQAQGYRRAYRRWAARHVAAMAVNGVLSREYVVEDLGFPGERVVTGQMAADTDGLARESAAVGDGEVEAFRKANAVEGAVILCAGRLHPLKGCRELVEAWRGVAARRPGEATLVLAGDGVLASWVRQQAEDPAARLRWLGPVAYDDMARVYAASDVLVSPTLEDNWSLVVPEAMACGLPVICSTCNGCWPELVKPDGNGWLCDVRVAGALEAALDDALAARARWAAMGRESQRMVSGYTPRRAAEAVWEACRMAAASGGGPGRRR